MPCATSARGGADEGTDARPSLPATSGDGPGASTPSTASPTSRLPLPTVGRVGRRGLPLLYDGVVAAGFDDVVKEELARIRRRAREIDAGTGPGRKARASGDSTVYEVEACAALAARRDAALRLRQILADDVDQFEAGMDEHPGRPGLGPHGPRRRRHPPARP